MCLKQSSQYLEMTRLEMTRTLYLKSSTDVNTDSKLNFEYSSFRILVACILANCSIAFHSRQTKTDLLVDTAFLSFTKSDGLTSIKWDDMLATNQSHRFCFQTQWAAFLTNKKRKTAVCVHSKPLTWQRDRCVPLKSCWSQSKCKIWSCMFKLAIQSCTITSICFIISQK